MMSITTPAVTGEAGELQTDLSVLTEADLDTIARSLNNRPRKRLGYMKPSERLAELLAMTA